MHKFNAIMGGELGGGVETQVFPVLIWQASEGYAKTAKMVVLNFFEIMRQGAMLCRIRLGGF